MIAEKIYNYFTEKDKEHKTSDNFAPSYLTKCKRQIYWKKTNEAPSNPISEAGYLKMGLGNATHDYLQNIFGELDLWIEGEDFKEINMFDLRWVYRIDGKLNLNGNQYLIEIKSLYANGFFAIENEPKEDNVLQLLCYMLFENVNNAILLYIGRDNGRMVEYQLEYKDKNLYINDQQTDYVTKLYDFIQGLKQCKDNINNSILPERDFEIALKNTGVAISNNFTKDKVKYKSNWQCDYCQYRDKCWKKEYQEIQKHKFFINNKFID